jgi:hypothetical protein
MDRLAAVGAHLLSTHPAGTATATSSPLEDVAAAVQLCGAEMDFYREHGFVVLPGVVDERACAVMYEEVLEICEKDPKIALDRDELRNGGLEGAR